MKKSVLLRHVLLGLICFGLFTTPSYATSVTSSSPSLLDDVTASPTEPSTQPLEWVLVEDDQLFMCYQFGDSIKVGFNLNLELAQILAAYSCDFEDSHYLPLSSDLNKKTVDYFSTFPKPAYTEDIKHYVTYDVVKKYINGQTQDILSYDKTLTKAIYPIRSNRVYGDTTFASTPNELFAILDDFSTYTNAPQFFQENIAYYEKISQDFRDIVSGNYIENLESILGPRPENATFTIILSPSIGGGTAIHLNDSEDQTHYFNIVHPSSDLDSFLMVLYHEEIHNFLDPTFSGNYHLYSNELFNHSLHDNVGSSNAFNETITRALTNIVLEKYHPYVDTSRILYQELHSGWVNMDRIYDFIVTSYLNNRTLYPSIGDFVPVLREYALSLDKDYVSALPTQTLYGITLSSDSKIILTGDEVFCDTLSSQIYSSVFLKCSPSFILPEYFEDPAICIFVSTQLPYSNLPREIRNEISRSTYNSLPSDTYFTLTVNQAQVTFVK